jgi:ribosomal protein L11
MSNVENCGKEVVAETDDSELRYPLVYELTRRKINCPNFVISEIVPESELWQRLTEEGYPAFKECRLLFSYQVDYEQCTVANLERLISLLRFAPLFMRVRILGTARARDQEWNETQGKPHRLDAEISAVFAAITEKFGGTVLPSKYPFFESIIGRSVPDDTDRERVARWGEIHSSLDRAGVSEDDRSEVRNVWNNGKVLVSDFEKMLQATFAASQSPALFGLCTLPLDTDPFDVCFGQSVALDKLDKWVLPELEFAGRMPNGRKATDEDYMPGVETGDNEGKDALSTKAVVAEMQADQTEREKADQELCEAFKKQTEKLADQPVEERLEEKKLQGFAFGLGVSPEGAAIWKKCKAKKAAETEDSDVLTTKAVAAESKGAKLVRLSDATGKEFTAADAGRLFSDFMSEDDAWKVVSKPVVFISGNAKTEIRAKFAEQWKHGRITVCKMERLLTNPLNPELSDAPSVNLNLDIPAISVKFPKPAEETVTAAVEDLEVDLDDEFIAEEDKVLRETMQKILDVLEKSPTISSGDLANMFAVFAHMLDPKPTENDCVEMLEMYSLRRTLRAVLNVLDTITSDDNVLLSNRRESLMGELVENGFHGLSQEDIAAGNFDKDLAAAWLEGQKKKWL